MLPEPEIALQMRYNSHPAAANMMPLKMENTIFGRHRKQYARKCAITRPPL